MDALHSPPGQGKLPAAHFREANAVYIVDRRMKPHRTSGIDRTGLELMEKFGIRCTLTGDGLDHLAAGEERLHVVQEFFTAVENADSHGAVDFVAGDFVAGESKEIRVQRLHVHRNVGRALSAVHNHHCAAISRMGFTLPRTLETWVQATIFVLSVMRDSTLLRSRLPSISHSINLRVAPV